MREQIEALGEQLASIEEQLRDLAYEQLADQAREPDSDAAISAAATEKRLNQARRAIARAIGALDALVGAEVGYDDAM